MKCYKCGSSPAHDRNIILHRFPKPGRTNNLRCRLWAKYCFPDLCWWSSEFHNKLHSRHIMLCTKHFKRSSFIDSFGKRLVKSAVPDEECDKKMDNLTTSIADDQSNELIKKEPEAEVWVQMTDPKDVVISDTSNSRENFSSSEYEESVESEIPKPSAFKEFPKEGKLEDLHNESLAVTLRDINTQLHVLINQRDDCFDNFGKYISSMLRIMPIQKSMELQPKIVALITSVGVSNNEGRISQSHENCS
ncbi:unnamed protein product [Parnassius mnemosyne]|uniref:THAP-type domain-containing protein n=1 Tax=Parnassius mnemosyne TaxID=213953 RepID=A0AAV1KU61_9NEOP